VNREWIYSIRKHFEIFKSAFDKPEEGTYFIKAGKINIKRMNDLGSEWKTENKEAKYTGITVVEKWKPTNHAHAEIVEDIKRGLARKIIKNLAFIETPPDL
jgi:hypothetical protein